MANKEMTPHRLEQLKALNNREDILTQLEEWFGEKPKLEFNRWIVDDNYANWIVKYDSIDNVRYGLDTEGIWFKQELDGMSPNNWENNRYATETEIVDMLSNYAINTLGLKEGVEYHYTERPDIEVRTIEGVFYLNNDGCLVNNGKIILDGKGNWAQVYDKFAELKEAYKNGKQIQAYSFNLNKWCDVSMPCWDDCTYYRIKPEPTYVPFTFEDREQLRGKWVIVKGVSKTEVLITSIEGYGVHTVYGDVSYEKLLSDYEFVDETPCGVIKEE